MRQQFVLGEQGADVGRERGVTLSERLEPRPALLGSQVEGVVEGGADEPPLLSANRHLERRRADMGSHFTTGRQTTESQGPPRALRATMAM